MSRERERETEKIITFQPELFTFEILLLLKIHQRITGMKTHPFFKKNISSHDFNHLHSPEFKVQWPVS